MPAAAVRASGGASTCGGLTSLAVTCHAAGWMTVARWEGVPVQLRDPKAASHCKPLWNLGATARAQEVCAIPNPARLEVLPTCLFPFHGFAILLRVHVATKDAAGGAVWAADEAVGAVRI